MNRAHHTQSAARTVLPHTQLQTFYACSSATRAECTPIPQPHLRAASAAGPWSENTTRAVLVSFALLVPFAGGARIAPRQALNCGSENPRGTQSMPHSSSAAGAASRRRCRHSAVAAAAGVVLWSASAGASSSAASGSSMRTSLQGGIKCAVMHSHGCKTGRPAHKQSVSADKVRP